MAFVVAANEEELDQLHPPPGSYPNNLSENPHKPRKPLQTHRSENHVGTLPGLYIPPLALVVLHAACGVLAITAFLFANVYNTGATSNPDNRCVLNTECSISEWVLAHTWVAIYVPMAVSISVCLWVPVAVKLTRRLMSCNASNPPSNHFTICNIAEGLTYIQLASMLLTMLTVADTELGVTTEVHKVAASMWYISDGLWSLVYIVVATQRATGSHARLQLVSIRFLLLLVSMVVILHTHDAANSIFFFTEIILLMGSFCLNAAITATLHDSQEEASY